MDEGGTASGEPETTLRREARPTRRIVRRVVLLALFVWFVSAGGTLAWAGWQARAGLDAADAARDAAAADVTSPEALAELREAHSLFESASRSAGAAHVVPLRLLPVLGRQIRSLDALAGGASRVADVSADALSAGQTALEETPGGRSQTPPLLRRLSEIAIDADRRLADIDLGPDEALLGPLWSARDKLADQLAELRTGLGRGAAGARAAADLLQGPRRYLVLAANNAEMRAGSGMFLSAGVLETRDGALVLSPFRPTEELAVPAGAVPLTGDLADRWGWLKPNEELRNLGVSPRFDVSAPMAAAMWEAAGGGRVDGVLAVDPVALRAVLAAVGSVDVEGRTIGADVVVDRILHDQYVEHAADPRQDARREDLGLIAGEVMRALDSRDWKADRLGRELAAASRGRHLLAWSSRAAEQEGWQAAGIDGSLRDDSVMVAVLNRGGNKLDRFLRVRAELDLRREGSGTEGTLRLTLRNETPAGEPPYVAGPHPSSGVGEGEYVGLVAVSLPAASQGARIEGTSNLAVAGADGPTRVVAAPMRVARGEEVTVVVRFGLPSEGGSLRVEPTARVPGVAWSGGGQEWHDGSAHTLTW